MNFITLGNGKRLQIITSLGEKRFVRGASRDVITFRFKEGTSVDEIGKLFGDKENLKKITLSGIQSEGQKEIIFQVLEGYTMCLEYGTKIEEVMEQTTEKPVLQEQPYVSIAQLTYIEQQLEKILGAD